MCPVNRDPGCHTSYFASRLSHDAARDRLWAVLCKHLQRDIPDSSRVLELGGGYCNFINNIRAAEKHVVDIYGKIRDYTSADVTSHVQSCANLDNLPAEYFDVAFASNLFEHLTRDELNATLSAVWRVLRDGGRLFVIQPNFKYAYRDYFDDYTHLQVFTHISLQDLLQVSGFRVERNVPRFLPFSIKSRLPKWPWLLRLYLASPWHPFAAQMYVVSRKTERQ